MKFQQAPRISFQAVSSVSLLSSSGVLMQGQGQVNVTLVCTQQSTWQTANGQTVSSISCAVMTGKLLLKPPAEKYAYHINLAVPTTTIIPTTTSSKSFSHSFGLRLLLLLATRFRSFHYNRIENCKKKDLPDRSEKLTMFSHVSCMLKPGDTVRNTVDISSIEWTTHHRL